jgi:hypothetical protein
MRLLFVVDERQIPRRRHADRCGNTVEPLELTR